MNNISDARRWHASRMQNHVRTTGGQLIMDTWCQCNRRAKPGRSISCIRSLVAAPSVVAETAYAREEEHCLYMHRLSLSGIEEVRPCSLHRRI